MSNRILGLEIGNRTVSGVVLISGIKGSSVESHARVQLEGPQDFGPNLSHALEALAETITIAGTASAVSLPAGTVSFRNVRLPFRDKKKLYQVLPYELELQLPHPIDDLVIDHYNTEPKRTDGSEVIAAAVNKATLASLLAVLQRHQIDPVTITVGGFATALCLKETLDPPENWILADIDGDALSLFFAEQNALKMIRATRLPRSGQDIDKAAFHHQVRHTLLANEDSSQAEDGATILLATEDTHQHLESGSDQTAGMGIPVTRTDLANQLGVREIQEPLEQLDSELPENALALAYMELTGLKGLNFRKGPFERKKQWAVHRKSIATTALLGVLFLMLALTNIILDTYLLDKKVSWLNQEIVAVFKETLPEVKRVVDPLQQMRVKLKEARNNLLLPAQDNKKSRAIDILKELSTVIPKKSDVNLTRLVISQESVLVSGNTNTFNAVDDIQNRLEKVSAFQKVVISSANQEKSGNRINFKLKVEL